MFWMRQNILMIVSILALSACAKQSPNPAPPTVIVPTAVAPHVNTLAEQRAACEDLYDHRVDLVVTDYAKSQNMTLDKQKYIKLKKMVAHTLSVHDADDRFFSQCLGRMTMSQIECAKMATTSDSADACTELPKGSQDSQDSAESEQSED